MFRPDVKLFKKRKGSHSGTTDAIFVQRNEGKYEKQKMSLNSPNLMLSLSGFQAGAQYPD